MDASNKTPMPRPTRSLSARLLVLTIAFVMLGEVLIYVPSVSRYRLVYLEERLAAAHEATLALEASPDGLISPELERDLLVHARVRSIALRMPDAAYLMLGTPPAIDASFDLREAAAPDLIAEAFMTLVQTRNRVLRVVGPARIDPRILIDVTLDEAPMRSEMVDYSGRILLLSIVLSLMTASLVYFSLHWLMVRPMRRITESLVAFRENPEDASKDIAVTDRSDEIGIAQREFAAMERGLRGALRQRAHLAALGAAVGKINHDLRNMLSTAVLVSDRLSHSDDPEVKRQAPALTTAIDRAVALCEDTLEFARAHAPELRRERLDLSALVDDVGRVLALPADGVYCTVAWVDGQPRDAVTNVGVRPTFGEQKHTVEAHLLNFDQDLYGKTLSIELIERIRPEQRFSGIDDLVAQLHRDVATARDVLAARVSS